MDDLRAIALENTANRQFTDNADAIQEEIFEGCKDTDSYEVIYSKMILNAIRISTRLSIGAIVDVLIDLGVVKPADEEQIRRRILKIMKPKK